MRARRLTFVLAVLLPAIAAAERPLTVAVASNFQQAARQVAATFEAQTGIPVRISTGSTGALYGRILHGAPYDVFLAADIERPRLLEESGAGLAGTRQTYAEGALVLWSRDPLLAGTDCLAELGNPGNHKVAIANPATAPYGRAAEEFLRRAGLRELLAGSLVYGENISQALQFVATGNARFGLVARAQLASADLPTATCAWPVPPELHAPVKQQLLVLRRAADPVAAKLFADFVAGEDARKIIAAAGYDLPEMSR